MGGVTKIHYTLTPWATSASASRHDLCCVGRGGEYQGGYDWKVRRFRWLKSSFSPLSNGSGGAMHVVKIMSRGMLLVHSSAVGRRSCLVTGDLQPRPWKMGATLLGGFKFCGAPRVQSLDFYGVSARSNLHSLYLAMAIPPLLRTSF
jgi:hypothetical protein